MGHVHRLNIVNIFYFPKNKGIHQIPFQNLQSHLTPEQHILQASNNNLSSIHGLIFTPLHIYGVLKWLLKDVQIFLHSFCCLIGFILFLLLFLSIFIYFDGRQKVAAYCYCTPIPMCLKVYYDCRIYFYSWIFI